MRGKVRQWDAERARELFEEGLSDLEIADMVGATPRAIAVWRGQEGLLRRKRGDAGRGPDGLERDGGRRGDAGDKPAGELHGFVPIQEIVEREKVVQKSPGEESPHPTALQVAASPQGKALELKRLLLELEVEGCEIVVRSDDMECARRGCDAVMYLLRG